MALPTDFKSCFSFSTDCVAAVRNSSRPATILSWVSFFAAAKSSSAFFACTDILASCSESGIAIAVSFWSRSKNLVNQLYLLHIIHQEDRDGDRDQHFVDGLADERGRVI